MADQDKPFWCEFCEDYHATIDCNHPSQLRDYECEDCENRDDENTRLHDILYEIKTCCDDASDLRIETSHKEAIQEILLLAHGA